MEEAAKEKKVAKLKEARKARRERAKTQQAAAAVAAKEKKASAEQTAAEKAATDEAKKTKKENAKARRASAPVVAKEEEEAKATRAEPRSRSSDDQGPTRKTCSVSFRALFLIGVVTLFGIFQCTQPAFSVTTGLSPRQFVAIWPVRLAALNFALWPLSREFIFEPSA